MKTCWSFVIILHFTFCIGKNSARNYFDGGSTSSSRIVGGLPANDIAIPYIVSLRNYGFHTCGGSILNERTIVTAAHCLAITTPRLLKVHVGDKTKMIQVGELINVDDIHAHPLWTKETMDYDVGLVRLARSLMYNSRIQPIALADENFLIRDGSYATVAGWGYTNIFGPGSEILRYARIPVVNQMTCTRIMGGAITDRMICAGDLNGGTDACQMDSGGPLVYRQKLIGLVSWGVGCALPNRPGVYTRISQVLPWIRTVLQTDYNEII